MRTVEIVTNGKTYLVVEIPDGYTKFRIAEFSRSGNWLVETEEKTLNSWKVKIPNGEWSILGFALYLSEKEWAGIVKQYPIVRNGRTFYKNYGKQVICKETPWVDTATESGKSWLEANGIADFKNPFILIKK